jgi:VIT1/CCC1 family predicted Fe2+/Mn2+ transporter
LKSVIYGGIDGVINATVILLTGYSANAPVDKLFALVFSATVVGAFDMALGDYISSKSEISFIAAQ